jgi:hypothetical protein
MGKLCFIVIRMVVNHLLQVSLGRLATNALRPAPNVPTTARRESLSSAVRLLTPGSALSGSGLCVSVVEISSSVPFVWTVETLHGDRRVLRGKHESLVSCVLSLSSPEHSPKTRIQVYNASNNELVRTNTLVKGAIIQVDATPFRQWYEAHVSILILIDTLPKC